MIERLPAMAQALRMRGRSKRPLAFSVTSTDTGVPSIDFIAPDASSAVSLSTWLAANEVPNIAMSARMTMTNSAIAKPLYAFLAFVCFCRSVTIERTLRRRVGASEGRTGHASPMVEGGKRAKGARRALVQVEFAVAVLVVLGAQVGDRVGAVRGLLDLHLHD